MLAHRRFPTSLGFDGYVLPATTASNYGVQVNAGSPAHTKGSWVDSGMGVLDFPISSLTVSVKNTFSLFGNGKIFLDIGVDLAGGTSFTAVIRNLQIGKAAPPTSLGGNIEYTFPFYVPEGATIGYRTQSATASKYAMISTFANGRLTHAESALKGMISETLGVDTATTLGTSFTPGNATDGSWVSLGTTSYDMWWWQPGYDINSSSVSAEATYIEWAWGDSSNKHRLFRNMHAGGSWRLGWYTLEHLSPYAAYCPLPAGTELWVRGKCQNAPDSGYNASIIGIG